MLVEEFFNSFGEDHAKKRYFLLGQKAMFLSKMRDRMGCVLLTRNNEPIIGFNNTKSHPLQLKYKLPLFSRHAEVQAIISAKQKRIEIENSTLYIYRETRLG